MKIQETIESELKIILAEKVAEHINDPEQKREKTESFSEIYKSLKNIKDKQNAKNNKKR